MIINNGYFKNEIYIPHAKPEITDDVTTVASDMLDFIEAYSRDCLVKCLGFALFKEFSGQLDPVEANGLKSGADQKWDDLLNGKEYTNTDGKLTEWRGLRYQNNPDGLYDKSLIAEYVYFHYEKDQDDNRVGVGNVKENAKNATMVSKNPKVTAAWRRFFKQTQDNFMDPTFVVKPYGYGIDYYKHGGEKTLYGFINDMNALNPETYKDFDPKIWSNKNQFGI